jgi:uncharacterized membrane protein
MYSKNRRQKAGKNAIVIYLTFAVFLFSLSASAQCAMCRAALEGEGNTAKAEAVNDGIVYLMAIPYIMVAAVGYWVYRMRRKKN